MRYEDLPEFARPYKKKGYDVRKQKDNYFLYKISSHREPGLKYPKLDQEYIGIIDSTGRLIRKKEYPSDKKREYMEWGLSSFIMSRYRRQLLRSVYNGSDRKNIDLVKLAIIQYVFGIITETAIRRCHLAREDAEKLLNLSKVASAERIGRLVNKIGELQKEAFGEDMHDAEILMKLCVMENDSIVEPGYPDEITALFEKHRIEP